MKKLLGLLAAFGLTASAGSAVVACGDKPVDKKTDLASFTEKSDLGSIKDNKALTILMAAKTAFGLSDDEIKEILVTDIEASTATLSVKKNAKLVEGKIEVKFSTCPVDPPVIEE
ncbi:lipoprotein [Spiroplasma alleghenense]|uniref:Lipoprotein n=1 Tax=Spiroplasma alleghenense TaxID=216931 RepID=A0A345Z3Q4_9MOLU|nr:lipoprotein [Spiroplasma alleghenense]AXK51233.1 hypothetical protein SALLE_v1c05590 [Spiroplasma alleghenense]